MAIKINKTCLFGRNNFFCLVIKSQVNRIAAIDKKRKEVNNNGDKASVRSLPQAGVAPQIKHTQSKTM